MNNFRYYSYCYKNAIQKDFNNAHFDVDPSVIEFISIVRGSPNIYDMLTSEYLRLFSEECVNEIINSNKPNFQLNMNKEVRTAYQEFEISILNVKMVLVIFYKSSDDSLSVSLKTNNKLASVTMTAITYFQEDFERKQVSIKTLDKSLFNIFKIDQFKQNYINTIKSKSLSLVVIFKIGFVHSAILNYIIRKSHKMNNFDNISKLSKHLLLLVFKNMNRNDEEIVLTAFMKWRTYRI